MIQLNVGSVYDSGKEGIILVLGNINNRWFYSNSDPATNWFEEKSYFHQTLTLYRE